MGTKWGTPTVEEVADLAKVSLRTAHRVIAGQPRSEESRKRVEAAIAELGYVPHHKRLATVFVCEVDGCEKEGPSRICGKHRERMRRTGTYADPPTVSLEETLWAQVERTEGCWRWSGSINRQGYGVFIYGSERWYSHRFIYELVVGQIPEGFDLDHACHSHDTACVEGPACPHRRCCNPDHLEPVTGPVNVERSVERRRTCRRGHCWVASNIYIRPDTGHRVCRACTALRSAAKARGERLVPTRRIRREPVPTQEENQTDGHSEAR